MKFSRNSSNKPLFIISDWLMGGPYLEAANADLRERGGSESESDPSIPVYNASVEKP